MSHDHCLEHLLNLKQMFQALRLFLTRDITAQTAAAAIIEFIPPHPNSKKFPASIPQTVPAIDAQLTFDPVSL